MRTLFLFLIALVVLAATGGVTTHASSADGRIKNTADMGESSNSVNHFMAIEDEKGNQNLMKTIGVFKVSGDDIGFELGAPISNKNYKTMIPENNALFDFE
jgi:hypothetical protein